MVGVNDRVISAVAIAPKVRRFVVAPSREWSRFSRALEDATTELESADFNDLWWVHSGNPAYVHAILSPSIAARLMKPDAVGTTFFGKGGVLVASDDTRGSWEATSQLDLLLDIVNAVPAFLIEKVAE
jgi:hypothetical protein